MSKIIFSELVEKVASTTGLSKQISHEFLKTLAATIETGLRKDGRVHLKGLGSFQLRKVAPRRGINPRTGESIIIPGHNKIVFHPSIKIKNKLNQNKTATTPSPKLTKAPIKEMPSRRSIRDLWKSNKIIKYGSAAAALTLVIFLGSLWLGGGDKIEQDMVSAVDVVPMEIPESVEIATTPEPQAEPQPVIEPVIQASDITTIDETPKLVEEVSGPTNSPHAIKSGDNLWTLAKEYYGDPYLWPLIYEHNIDLIENPDILLPGTEIYIPDVVVITEELENTTVEGLARANALVYQAYSQNNTPGAQDFLKVALSMDPGIAETLGIDWSTDDILVTQARE